MEDNLTIHLDGALTWQAAGMSVIPVRADGTKKPLMDWKSYQNCAATEREIRQWYRNPELGIAVICGKVSGNLEMLELEGSAATADDFTKIAEALEAPGLEEGRILWQALCEEGYYEST